jgi:hypothetical protein
MAWQAFIQQNYNQLRQMSLVYKPLHDDIMTHLCLYLENNWLKFDVIPDNQKLRWLGRWMRNQATWSNSAVNRDNRTNNLPEDQQFELESDDHLSISIMAEDVDDSIKGWIADTNKQFGSDKTDKLIRIKYTYYKSLTLAEQILFNLYFDEMLTHRAIAKRLKIPLTSSFLMVKNLELKLINLCFGTQSIN